MQLKKLTLINIGPYMDKNTFKLDTTKKRNTILFGGKNGSGKTTLLNSFRIALYGPLAFGYRSVSSRYKDKIIELLNRDVIKESNSSFEMKLNFSVMLNFERKDYTIIRSWDVKGNDLIEHVSVLKENFPLSATDQGKFFELLRTEYPPKLLELCFFDGEEILKLTNENLLTDYLKELSYSLFNIDLFSELESILDKYTEQTANTALEKKLLKHINQLNNKIDEKVKSINVLKETLAKSQSKIKDIEQEIDLMNLEFRLHGGLLSEEREEIKGQINSLNSEREQIAAELKEFIASKLPLYISNRILTDLIKQLRVEENYHISKALKDKIENLPMKNIIDSLNIKATNNLDKGLKNELIKHLGAEEETQIIHNLSSSEMQNIYNLYSDITKENLLNQIKQIKRSEEHLVKTRKLRNLIKDNEENSEFNELINKINKGNEQIRELENETTLLIYKIDNMQQSIDELSRQRDKLENELSQLQRKRSSFVEAEKILTASTRFRELQLRRKIKDVEIFALSMIKRLMRKEDFIETIQIDPKSFEISLFNRSQNKISVRGLSAGERQILILSVIWGTLKSANRNIPIILDTMFGRLDDEHKLSIVNKLIPEFSKQVIVLATNSEVPKNLYTHFKKNISNEYTLNYNSAAERTIVNPGFFGVKRQGMKVND